MIGPGRYDEECTVARQSAQAAGAVLIIFDGRHGHGFAAQLPAQYSADLVRAMRDVVEQMEADLKELKR